MLFSQSSILFSGQCGRNCLRCSRVRNAELLLPKETTPSAWFPRMRQHYVSFCVQESSSPSNKFRQGPRQPHRNWWSHEILARAPKILGEGKLTRGLRQRTRTVIIRDSGIFPGIFVWLHVFH